MNNKKNTGVQLAIEKAGSQVQLAERMGVRQPSVWRWLHRNLPAERAKQIEDELKIPRRLLRPDIFE